MQKIMQHIIEEASKEARSPLEFSCEQMELTLVPGALYEGTLTVYGPENTWGYIISPDRRLEVLNREFSGAQDTIEYRFNASYLEAGDEIKGELCFISNQGEYMLPFLVQISEPVIESTQGEIKNLNQFAALARSNWGEAVSLFYAPEFLRLIKGNDRKYMEIYRGLSARPGNQRNMEEFLVACGKKQAVHYGFKEEILTCTNPIEMTELSLTVCKDGWGYTGLQIVTDGEFVFTEKEMITDDDFLGNQCTIPVYIDPDRLRRGKNYGSVRLLSTGVSLQIPVHVLVGEGNGSYQSARLERKRLLAQLMESYLLYRMKKTTNAQWLEKTGSLVEHLVAMDDQNVAARLFQAQLLITQERTHEGSWVLTHAMELMEKQGVDDPALMAYYLYLTTLVNHDGEYVRRATAQIEDIYRRNRTSWKTAWLLMYLSVEYRKDNTARWALLERQFGYGCCSPVWYLEALITLSNNPALLRKLGDFEVQVLYYGARKELLGPELLEQMLYLAARKREYTPVLLNTLMICYRRKEDNRLLQEICAQLIKGGRTDASAYEWYERGVENELRLTRLYEFYMTSMNLEEEPDISRKALLYFAWQSNMDYEHAAYLYYYLLKHREEYTELLERYKERMERFVVDQIIKEHINRHLAYLYQELLVPAMFSAPLAEHLTKLLFARMITVENTNITAVYVYRPDLMQAAGYPLVTGSTWISLYGEKDTIILEDAEGNRYVSAIPFTVETLMNPEPFTDMTAVYTTPDQKNSVEWEKYLWDRSRKQESLPQDIVERGKKLLKSPVLSDFIKGRIQMRLLSHYKEEGKEAGLEEYLEQISWEVLDASSRREVLTNLVLRGKMDKAYEWLMKFGSTGLEPQVVSRLCSFFIEQTAGMQDDGLTEASAGAFRQGKYEGTVLKYLALHYQGPLSELERIQGVCKAYDVDTFALCERMLEQLLLTGADTGRGISSFRYYLTGETRRDIVTAFLRRCAYEYLAHDKETDDFIFLKIMEMYIKEVPVGNTEKLACLKYFAEKQKPENEEQVLAQRAFLKEMLGLSIHLNFFKKLDGCEKLLKPLQDKTIVEHKEDPDTKVTIHYMIRREDGEEPPLQSEELPMAPGGIFFKEFVLFHGETLQYYFTIAKERQKGITQTWMIHKEENDDSSQGRFHVINEILRSSSEEDWERMDAQLEELYHKEYLGNSLFRMR